MTSQPKLVRRNVVANLFGQGWAAVLQLVLLPIYLKFLGVEAYALVGLYVMLLTFVQIFDLGLAQTLNRELARRSAVSGAAGDTRDLVKTLESLYAGIVILVCIVLYFLAPHVASYALKPAHLSPQAVAFAVSLMAIVIGMQWQTNLYVSGLMGMQRQVLVNTLRIVLTTIGGAGAVLVLWLISPSITAFFTWQAIFGLISLISHIWALHASLPGDGIPAKFRPDLLHGVWRFAAGMSALTISALLLTQLDKWILAKILPLEVFGYFMLAVTVAASLNLLVTPIFAAIYPRFSGLIVSGDKATLIRIYHLATQAVSVTLFPLAIFLSLFSGEVLLLWTGSAEVAGNSGPILSLLVIGTALNGLTHLPYAWELAHGRTRIFLVTNCVAIAVLAPAIWYFAGRYGAIAAAVAWIVLNASYMLVTIPIIHRVLDRKNRLRWYWVDVVPPAVASGSIAFAVRLYLPDSLGKLEMLAVLGLTLAACLSAAVLVCGGIRAEMAGILKARLDSSFMKRAD